MAYYVDRVVICDAFREPDKHYALLPGGRSRLMPGRRPSVRFIDFARAAKRGITGLVGDDPTLFDEMAASNQERNETVNQLRDEVQDWRKAGYPNTSGVTRRLLEWWFERDEERRALGRRFFFCQQEAIETVIYLYEVQQRRRMPGTEDLLRYALKLATGTGKTVVMALFVTWSTLHRRKVVGSSLSTNFLVMVPNLTVLDRVSGSPRGDGVLPDGEANLYKTFDTVPPEYRDEFHPNVIVKNWQSVPLETARDDWISENVVAAGRFVPAAVLQAVQRRARRDPDGALRRMLDGARDVVVINDEAHHVYGEKRARKDETPDYIKWNKILKRVSGVARVSLVIDLSATPWYGTGSPKPDGTLFEWLVSDFSVYDAFESGLVKVVRLPDPNEVGHIYIDLWDKVKDAKSQIEYISASKGAFATIYASWRKEFEEWESRLEYARDYPSPVLLCVADKAERAKWLYDHLRTYDLLGNEDEDDPRAKVTIQVDHKIFDAEKGNEAILREMVSTVGRKGKPGEHVRAIVSVNMLSEGWDVQSVSHILGLRAFGSPLLTEQVIGRGLRRTNYDVLNQPLEQRPEGSEETVDAFGIPFVGFPVERRKRPKSSHWGDKPIWIEPVDKKDKFQVRVPNVRSWAVGVVDSLWQVVRVEDLPELRIDPRETPPEVRVKPVVGGQPETVMTLEEFRRERPLLRTCFTLAQELFEATNPGGVAETGTGPTFDELLGLTRRYVGTKVRTMRSDGQVSDIRDVGIDYWRRRAHDTLENAIRSAESAGTESIPILGAPEWLDSRELKRFQWTGLVADGKRSHTSKIPCHSPLEKQFAEFLDTATDVVRYLKNERFGFSITYYEADRPRQYFPDFIVALSGPAGTDETWLVETKGEIRINTALKANAAKSWCERMSRSQYGRWRYFLVEQPKLQGALGAGLKSLRDVLALITVIEPGPIAFEAPHPAMPLVKVAEDPGEYRRGPKQQKARRG